MAKEVNKRVNLWLNQQGISNDLKSVRAAILKTTNELAKLPAYTEKWYEKSKNLQKLKGIYGEMQTEIKMVAGSLETATEQTRGQIMAWGGLASIYQTASGSLRRFISATQEYVDAYARVDDLMQAVVKSSGLAREEIERLRKSFADFNTRTSTEELLKIAEIGGHLGLAKEQLHDFVQYTDQAMQTIGLSAEDVANGFSRIQRTFKEVASQDISETIRRAGSAMNALDKVTTSTEANIMAFTEAVGQLSEGVKPSLADTLALGAAFESAGIDAQRAAMGYARILTTARADVAKFAEVMGRPTEEIKELINTRPAEFLLEFAESLRALPASEQGEKLKALQLNSQRLDSTIGALTGHTDEFRKALSLSASEYEKATAMTENYNALNRTRAAQLALAKKRLEDVKIELGERLMPIMTGLYEKLSSGVGWLTRHAALVMAVMKAVAMYIGVMGTFKVVQATANGLIAAGTALHKAHRVALIASAAAQALFNKNTTRANAAMVLMKRELPGLTRKLTELGGSLSTIGRTIMRLGPLALIAGVVAGVVKLNKEAQTGKRIVEEADRASRDAFAQGRSDIEVEKVKIDELRNIINDENESRENREKAIRDLKEMIPGYVAELSEEGRVTRENTKAIDDYISSLENRLEMDVLEQKLKDLMAQRNEIEEKYKKAQENYTKSWWGRMWATVRYEMDEPVNLFQRQLAPLNAEIDKLLAKSGELQKKNIKGTVSQTSEDEHTGDPKTCMCADCVAERKRKQDDLIREQIEALKERRKKLDSEIAKLKTEAKRAELGEWDKTKADILDRYQQLIDEANALGRKSDAEWLEQEKDNAIERAGRAYVEKAGKALTDARAQAEKLLKESDPDKDGNKLMAAIVGTEEQWNEQIAVAQGALKMWNDRLEANDLTEDERRLFSEEAAEADEAVCEMMMQKAQAVSNTIRKYAAEDEQFVESKNRELMLSEMSDKDRRLFEINELYNARIAAKKNEIAALEQMMANDPNNKDIEDQIAHLQDLIAQMEQLRQAEIKAASTSSAAGRTGNVWEDLINIDWANFKDNWQENLQTMTAALKEFADAAFDIFNSINQIQSNREQAAFDEWSEIQDEKADRLKRQLEEGLISQAYYDAQMEQLEKEKVEKEKQMQHEQFEREKKAGIAQALIQGALAIVTAFAQMGPIAGAIAAVIVAATTALQVAAIASQVNPYAKGGFIRGEQMALMGEQGDEWVASNRLLEDRKTAPVIAALEAYQRGNRRAIDDLVTVEEPRWEKLSQSSRRLSRTFAGDSVGATNIYNTNTNNSVNADTLAVLTELQTLNRYLKDPKNRQAYISRKMQLEYEENENELKEMARL